MLKLNRLHAVVVAIIVLATVCLVFVVLSPARVSRTVSANEEQFRSWCAEHEDKVFILYDAEYRQEDRSVVFTPIRVLGGSEDIDVDLLPAIVEHEHGTLKNVTGMLRMYTDGTTKDARRFIYNGSISARLDEEWLKIEIDDIVAHRDGR